MFENRAPIVVSLLLLFVLVSTSAGFASISGVQDQLRAIQLKVLQEKARLIQQSIIDAGKQQIKERDDAKAREDMTVVGTSEPDRAELESTLQSQIMSLQNIIRSLRPRAIDEETDRIEKRIGQIKVKVRTASGKALGDLQTELNGLLAEYDNLQTEVRQQLSESITYRQALVIQEQIRAVQARVQVLPTAHAAETEQMASKTATKTTVKGIEDTLEKLRLKVIQAQIKAIQEKITNLKK